MFGKLLFWRRDAAPPRKPAPRALSQRAPRIAPILGARPDWKTYRPRNPLLG